MPCPRARGGSPGRGRRCPAEHGRVERDDERLRPGCLGPADHRVDEALVGRPVELVPEGGAGHRLRRLLHRRAALAGEDVGHAAGVGPLRDEQVGVVGDEPGGTDRGEEQRCGELGVQDRRRQVTRRRRVQHPRHDLPAVEGGPVGAHRGATPGSARDVGPCLAAQGCSCATLELADVRGDGGRDAERTGSVDRVLTGTSEGGLGSRHERRLGAADRRIVQVHGGPVILGSCGPLHRGRQQRRRRRAVAGRPRGRSGVPARPRTGPRSHVLKDMRTRGAGHRIAQRQCRPERAGGCIAVGQCGLRERSEPQETP